MNYAKEFYTNYAKHSHDTLCISIIKKGKIGIEFHNKEIQYLEPNNLVIYNPLQVHVSKKTNVKSYGYYALHLYEDWIIKIFKNIYFEKNVINDKSKYNEFLILCENLQNNNALNKEKRIYDFFNEIVKVHASKISKLKKQNNHFLDLVKEYIEVNISNDITLNDLSNEVGYSKEHIIRLFKKEFGLTPHAFLINKKVNMAKKRLLNDETIATVSSNSGFYDQSHFLRNFKKMFGISPKNYKMSD